jgi:predicted nucleic-acid-binding Zn-ribbon protein/peroxiredoxin
MSLAQAPIGVGAPAPDPKVTRTNSRSVQLSSLWRKRPLVLEFLPPIAGPHGEDKAVRLRDGREAFSAAGANLAAVCRAAPEEAKAFDGRWNLGYDLLCDARGAAFDAFSVTEEAPGSFVIETSGAIRYAHRNQDQADSPPLWDMVDAVCALTGATVERPRLTPVNLEPEDGKAESRAGGRGSALDFVCSKCGNTSYEIETLSPAGGSVSRLFSSQNRKFSAVTCTNCKHTELYKAEGSALAQAFDRLARG